jgi:lipid-binding SYLF domain-containing protein
MSIDATRRRLLVAGAGLAASAALLPRAARAEGEQLLVDEARITVERFTAEADMQPMRNMLSRAQAAFIFPQLLKGGFIIGGEGGSGVLVARNQQTGDWGAPAFYALFAASIGFQAGGEVSQAMLLVMTAKGLDAVFRNEFKLGADVSATVGPVGRGIEAAATTNLRDDMYTFAMSKGLFGGVSLEGAIINARYSRNMSYYGSEVAPRDIVLGNSVVRAGGAQALQAALRAAAVNRT